jgi:hypothetical protein
MLKNPVTVDNQVRIKGTAIPALRERNFVMDEREISQLFQSYFNNKMTLLLFLIQAKSAKENPKLVESSSRFIDDIYHHMLSVATQKEQRLVFKWLKIFFRRLPDVSVVQRSKAKNFILYIYDAMGLSLKSSI